MVKAIQGKGYEVVTLEKLYQRYETVRLREALSDRFDFKADAEAYASYVHGGSGNIERLIEERGGRTKPLKAKLLRRARRAYDGAKRPKVKYASKLVSVEKIEKGKQKGEYVAAVFS